VVTPVRNWVLLPNGEQVRGRYPGQSACQLLEHHLRDELARQLRGATEAVLPYGRADVMTADLVFEVEPVKAWRHAVRQVLAYSVQCNKVPAVALFGATHRDEVLRIYLRLRDGKPPVQLWWHSGLRWGRIGSRAACRNMAAPSLDA
jgi:hypothetical protein